MCAIGRIGRLCRKICKFFTGFLLKRSDPDQDTDPDLDPPGPDPDPQHCFYAYPDLTIVCSPGAALALLSIDVELVDVLQAVVGQADVGPRVEGRHGSVPHAVRSTLPLTSGTWKNLLEDWINRLNMELDLQSLFGLHFTWCVHCTAVLIGWDPASPPSHAFGLIYEGPYWSAKTDDISF